MRNGTLSPAHWDPDTAPVWGDHVADEESSAVTASTIRRAMGRVPTAVSVVTALVDGRPVGMTIGSLTSVSLSPALVAFFVFTESSTFRLFRKSQRFCINVLSAQQSEVSDAFARLDGAKFGAGQWDYNAGTPMLRNSVAHMICTSESIIETGDHLGMIARVIDVEFSNLRPLIYYRGKPVQLQSDRIEEM